MGAKRQHDADAKDLKQALAAFDQRRERTPSQKRWDGRQEARNDDGESHEVKDPVRREIGLIVGIEWLQHPMRKKSTEIWCTNGHRHDESKYEICHRQPERGPC